MAQIIMAKQFSKDLDIDGSIQGPAWRFLGRLMEDHTTLGLHIEPINGSADDRVRTGRVTQNYRAVMFLVEPGDDPTFLVAAIKKHDEANRLAERIVLKYNPVTRIPELVVTRHPDDPPPSPSIPPPQTAAGWNCPLLAFTRDELIQRLGITPDIVDAGHAAASEAALYEVIDQAPGWQSDALLSLVCGDSIDALIQSLELDTPTPTPEAKETDAFDKPGARADFTRITSDEDLMQVLSGSFAAWRTFLHPDQRRYAYRESYNGAFRLNGGAGTGKTVVALHRARHLAQTNPSARIVVTTYTTTLADNLLRSFEELDPSIPLAAKLGDPGVLIMGVDKLAVAALKFAGPAAIAQVAPHFAGAPVARIAPLPDAEDRTFWDNAITEAGQGLRADLSTTGFLVSEYRTVILAQRVDNREDYARVARPGRGTRLSRAERLAVWRVVERYRELLGEADRATFAEIAAIAGAALALDPDHPPADHVVIDEAQDLHGGHWRLLRALAAQGPDDLFICEDSHQRIYGEKVVLNRFGIAVRGRSRRLTLNYRTTRQNLGYAVGILEGADITDLEGNPEDMSGYRSALSGPPPRLIAATSATDELESVATVLKSWMSENGAESDTFAVLVRDRATRDRIARGLASRGVKVQVIEGADKPVDGKPQVLTMHRAKGLEFRRVILAGISKAALSTAVSSAETLTDEQRNADERQRMLLYVAATRARDELVVTWTGAPSDLLPQDTA